MKAGDVNSVGGDQNKTIATNGTNVFVPSTAAVDMTPNLNSEDEANNANRNTIGDKKFDGVTPRNNKENIVKNINEMNEDNEFSASENSSGNENSVATEEQTPDSVSSECNGENLGMASEMLINMSQSSPSDLEQLEGKDQINEELKVSLRVLCKDVMKDVKTLESRHNIKAMDIAIRFAEHLKNNTSVKLYTLEKGSRSKRSPSNSTDITHDGLFLKASPFLLLAYNEMKALYRKSGIKRWDQSFKNFTWNVFNVLITLDKDLDSLNNYKLKKAHKYDLLQDKFTLYWLDPIEEVDSSSSDEFITNDLQNGKINSKRKLTPSGSTVTREKSERISNIAKKPKETTTVVKSFTKKRRSYKKKSPNVEAEDETTIIDNIKSAIQYAYDSGIKVDVFNQIYTEVYLIDDDDDVDNDEDNNDDKDGNDDKDSNDDDNDDSNDNNKLSSDNNILAKENMIMLKNGNDDKDNNDDDNDDSNDNDTLSSDNNILAKQIADLINITFSLKISPYIKVPKVMEEFFEVLEGKSVLTIEEYILSEGSNENGIHQRHFKPKEKVIGCNTDNFFNKIGSYLNMDVSDKFGFVVMMNTNDEVFVRASEEQYYTLLFGYKPNTKLQIVQKVNDIAKIDVIEFTKGDLIILNNSVEYTYGSATYTENKIFEVIYMFFNSKP